MTEEFNPDKPPLESAQRPIEVDMSPGAIDRRGREMGELWEVLRRFRPAARQTNGNPNETVKQPD